MPVKSRKRKNIASYLSNWYCKTCESEVSAEHNKCEDCDSTRYDNYKLQKTTDEKTNESDKKINSNDICPICVDEPINGILIHGDVNHRVCCIACSTKLFFDQEPCPLCRQDIEYVMATT